MTDEEFTQHRNNASNWKMTPKEVANLKPSSPAEKAEQQLHQSIFDRVETAYFDFLADATHHNKSNWEAINIASKENSAIQKMFQNLLPSTLHGDAGQFIAEYDAAITAWSEIITSQKGKAPTFELDEDLSEMLTSYNDDKHTAKIIARNEAAHRERSPVDPSNPPELSAVTNSGYKEPEPTKEAFTKTQREKAEGANGTFAEYITASIYSLASATTSAGIVTEELEENVAAQRKLSGYKELDSSQRTSPNKVKIISALEGLSELEEDVISQSEALGKPIINYQRPELPLHLKLVLEQIDFSNIPISNNRGAANDEHPTRHLHIVPTSLAPDETEVNTPAPRTRGE